MLKDTHKPSPANRMVRRWWLWPIVSLGSLILCYALILVAWDMRYAALAVCAVVLTCAAVIEFVTMIIAAFRKLWKKLALTFGGLLVTLATIGLYGILVLGGAIGGMFRPDDYVPEWAREDTTAQDTAFADDTTVYQP